MEYLGEVGKLMFNAVLPVLVSVLVLYLVRIAKEHVGKIKDEKLRLLVEELVRAAEQIYGAGGGIFKYKYVVGELKHKGKKVGRAAIEAAVYELSNWEFLTQPNNEQGE